MSSAAAGSGRALPFVVLGIALVAVSNGAILARLADAPALAIAAWRVGLAVLVVLPFALTATRAPQAGARAIACAAGAGVLLALHFATWIASLEHTTVARSVLLVSTSPIWVALLQFATGAGAFARGTVASLALALAGAAVVSGGGQGDEGALQGDLLAVAGGIAMAGYFLLSRAAQSGLSFRSYLGIAYGVAAAVLWAAVLWTDTQASGFDARTWWALAGMAAVSQLIGHSGYNWSLRHLDPFFVAVVSVGEPVLAAVLAWWLLGEPLDWRTGAGGALILAGIALATLQARPRA
ncbi:MAG TPA: DMT family transporter [Steroidobacteraceae bacterium]|nr:DMT family transporter [Steroidobacteraceae bacterium]